MRFQSNHGSVAPSDALYVVFIGGNDVRFARSVASFTQARFIVQTAASEVRQAIETLAQAGANSILLVNAANVGATPETRIIAEADNDPKLIKRTRKLSTLYRKELHEIAEDLVRELIALTARIELHFFRRDGAIRCSRQSNQQTGPCKIADAVPISDCPSLVEHKAIPGHWEGDLIVGTNNSYIAALFERHSSLVILSRVTDNTNQVVIDALIEQSKKLPTEFFESRTRDRG